MRLNCAAPTSYLHSHTAVSLTSPPEHFSTHRLFCRRTRRGDAEAIFAAYAADADVTRFLAWRPHANVESLAAFLDTQVEAWDAGSGFRYEVCAKGTDTPIGSIAARAEGARVNFGYVLAKPYWGRGLMAEALEWLIGWALAQPGVFRADAFCDVENLGSVRVMEKAGMKREGILRRWHVCPNLGPDPRDCIIYASTR